MNARIKLGLALLLGAAATGSLGQERAPAPAAPSPPPPAAQPPAAPRPQASDDVFIPTEELQADDQVTFPVDI